MMEYITLSDLVREVVKKAEEKNESLSSEKKIREKYINIFDMMNLDREKLRGRGTGDYKLPKESQDFLVDLNWLYLDNNGKKMRKGLFEQADLESIAKLLDGFREMILKLDISDNDKDDMLSKMYMRTKYPYLKRREDILKELENIKLDFCPNYQEDARIEDELQRYVDKNECKKMMEMHKISAQRRFRYFDILDNLDANDELLFTSFVLEDIRCMIRRHHELYSYISEIRTCEINDAAEQRAYDMTKEEEEYAAIDFNYSIKLQEELDRNEEYKELMAERKTILRSNDFVNKLQPRFEAVCERLQEIGIDTQKELWGEVVLNDEEDEKIDFSFRETSENVFKEALKTYRDSNKSSREFKERMGVITEEESLRMKEFIEQLEEQRKKPQ